MLLTARDQAALSLTRHRLRQALKACPEGYELAESLKWTLEGHVHAITDRIGTEDLEPPLLDPAAARLHDLLVKAADENLSPRENAALRNAIRQGAERLCCEQMRDADDPRWHTANPDVPHPKADPLDDREEAHEAMTAAARGFALPEHEACGSMPAPDSWEC